MNQIATPGHHEIKQEILKGVEHWNSWRQQYDPSQLDLSGVNLKNRVLDGIDFSSLMLVDANITGCSLRDASFINANCSRAYLRQNDFIGARMIAANLQGADLSQSVINNASMLMVNTLNSCLENIDFRGHDLSTFSLRGASLKGSNLEGQFLAKADLCGVDLENANLTNADLSYANLSAANLRKANLRASTLESTNFKNADLHGISLRGMNLADLNFTGADLSDCDLRESVLHRAKLEKANLTGAKLWKVDMHRWNITGVRCDFAYWGNQCDVKTVYRKFEFERLYTQTGTVEIIYPYHISTQEVATIPILIEHLQASFWGVVLRLKTIVEVVGGTLVALKIDEYGNHNPATVKHEIQTEAERMLNAHVALRGNSKLLLQLREEMAQVKERFWPRLLELAEEHEREQSRTLTIVFMDLKGFTSWGNDELSEKLRLFRGLIKPILKKWQASHPNMEGDSLRITFTNASAALACACMIKGVLTGAGFELRIGVELGGVSIIHNEVTGIPDLEGTAVSMAARLEASANPGQVLASASVKQYSEHRDVFEFTPVRIRLNKSIADLPKGSDVDCFDVSLKGNLDAL